MALLYQTSTMRGPTLEVTTPKKLLYANQFLAKVGGKYGLYTRQELENIKNKGKEISGVFNLNELVIGTSANIKYKEGYLHGKVTVSTDNKKLFLTGSKFGQVYYINIADIKNIKKERSNLFTFEVREKGQVIGAKEEDFTYAPYKAMKKEEAIKIAKDLSTNGVLALVEMDYGLYKTKYYDLYTSQELDELKKNKPVTIVAEHSIGELSGITKMELKAKGKTICSIDTVSSKTGERQMGAQIISFGQSTSSVRQIQFTDALGNTTMIFPENITGMSTKTETLASGATRDVVTITIRSAANVEKLLDREKTP